MPPKKIVDKYEMMRRRDPTRPIFMNLGQGVAWEGWVGRGERTGQLSDYPEYLRGTDIVSFDIYPVVHRSPEVAGKLWYVAQGVERLRRWANEDQVVWNVIEASRISNTETKPSPRQVRSEAWMSLIHGSRGLIYFVHQFEPRFVEASLLEDDELLEVVTEVNHRIERLAPVLNSPTIEDLVNVTSSTEGVPVDYLVKEHDGAVYVFAVCMRGEPTTATVRFEDAAERDGATVQVLGEDRSLRVQDSSFTDEFEPYGVHLYRVH